MVSNRGTQNEKVESLQWIVTSYYMLWLSPRPLTQIGNQWVSIMMIGGISINRKGQLNCRRHSNGDIADGSQPFSMEEAI